jgi:hypothetical protein
MNTQQGIILTIPLRPRKLVLPGILLVGLAALLLTNKESAARYAPVPGDPPAELRLLPADTFVVVHVNLASLMKEDLPKKVLPLFAALALDGEQADFGEKAFGVKLGDVEAVAVLEGKGGSVNVVTARNAIDRDAVVKAVAPRASEQTFKDKKFFGTKRDRAFRDKGPLKDSPPRDGFKDARDFKKEGGFLQEKDDVKYADRVKKDRGGPDSSIDSWAKAVYFLSDRTYVYGQGRAVMHFISTAEKPDDKAPLSAALATAGKHHLTIGLTLPEKAREEGERDLKRVARFGPSLAGLILYNFKPLLYAKSGVLTADLGDEIRVDGAINFPDGRNAAAGADSVKLALALLKGGVLMIEDQIQATGGDGKLNESVVKVMDQLRTSLNEATVKTDGTTVKASVKTTVDAAAVKVFLEEGAKKVAEAARRAAAQNNLKQLSLAIINYADSMNGKMPTAVVYSPDGKPLYSWRVAILPYIDELALYKKLKLDEPWDSEHNKPLLAKTPKAFQLPGVKTEEGMTFFQVFTGMNTPFPDRFPTRFPASFTDGTSNTILVIEAAEPVHWAAPKDLPYSARVSPKKQIGKHFGKGTLVTMCDGSVRMIPATVTEEDLRAAITPNGGEVIGNSFYGDDEENPFGGGRKEKSYKDKAPRGSGSGEKDPSRESPRDFPRDAPRPVDKKEDR